MYHDCRLRSPKLFLLIESIFLFKWAVIYLSILRLIFYTYQMIIDVQLIPIKFWVTTHKYLEGNAYSLNMPRNVINFMLNQFGI